MRHGTAGMAAAAAVIAALAGCTTEDEEIDLDRIGRDGAVLYADFCAACHGPRGQGDGPLAESLRATPPDLTRIAARSGGSFDYAAVMSDIDGYKRGPRAMPQFGALFVEAPMIPFDSGDGILTPTPFPLVALATHLEALQRP